MGEDCLFCRIVRGEIPAEEVFSTDKIFAFRDISPVAPVHILVIPKAHIASLDDLENAELGGNILLAAAEVARREGIAETGYRLVINSGQDAGQSVDHLHAHVLGNRSLQWPPG